MIWLSWRQLRTSTALAALGLGAAAVVLLVTGLHLNHLYSAYRSCDDLTCDTKLNLLETSYPRVKLIGTLLVALPGLVGIFWGAPLVSRELESGTFRLAWTQAVTRTRWIATKLAIAGAISAIAAGVLTFAVSWWAIPFDRIDANRIIPSNFGERGIVPVAYALFAFALGAAAGILIRRTVPAIAATIGGFVAVRMIVQLLVRPHLVAPLTKSVPLTAQLGIGIKRTGDSVQMVLGGRPELHAAWVTGAKLTDASGHAPSTSFVTQACQGVLQQTAPLGGRPIPGGSGIRQVRPSAAALRAFNECLSNVGQRYHEVVSYQPESRFWELQWLESAIFLGLTAALVGLSVYWVRRRLV
jgi:hypothetical protein